MLCQSVVCNVCIVAKWCMLPKLSEEANTKWPTSNEQRATTSTTATAVQAEKTH